MPRFFCEPGEARDGVIVLGGADAEHIARVLRMRAGDCLTVCDGRGKDYRCVIESIERPTRGARPSVVCRVEGVESSSAEPGIKATLYQCLPKGDKMEQIVQKAVELGAFAVVPVISARCVSRPQARSLDGKLGRWQRIAEEAAKQCGRGMVPQVLPYLSFEDAVDRMRKSAAAVMFYEGECASKRPVAEIGGLASLGEIAILIGPEGGFEKEEAELAERSGIFICGLGPRILRTETAPICALSIIMYMSGNL